MEESHLNFVGMGLEVDGSSMYLWAVLELQYYCRLLYDFYMILRDSVMQTPEPVGELVLLYLS